MGRDVILSTQGLTRDFKGFTAVSNVDLNIRRGTIHALIGPNGAGKTTCFNLLTKFLDVTRGAIQYNGRDITAMKPADIARLGLVRSFQISAVFPHLTVLENVRIALQRRRGDNFDFWRSEKVLHALDPDAAALVEAVASPNSPIFRRSSSPTAASAPWRSPPRSPSTPRCCSSTSQWPAWATRTSTAPRN